MKLKGEALKFPRMYIFDSIMRRTFGRSVKLVLYYGPVQMCVFGLEYEYKPKNYKFKVECERRTATWRIRECVPQAMQGVAHLIVAEKETDQIVAFMGVENDRLEMYGVREVTVNEQNPDAVGFYEHLGFETYKRTDLDEEGNLYPLLYMRWEEMEDTK